MVPKSGKWHPLFLAILLSTCFPPLSRPATAQSNNYIQSLTHCEYGSISGNENTNQLFVVCGGQSGGGGQLTAQLVVYPIGLSTSSSSINLPSCSIYDRNPIYVNSVTNAAYVACGGTIMQVVGGGITTIADSSQCSATAVDIHGNTANGIIYAACSNGLIAITYQNGQYHATSFISPSLCPSPTAIHVNSGTGVVYAGCMNGIISIDPSTVPYTIRSLVTYSQCPSTSGIALDSRTGIVYAACKLGGVIAIDVTNGGGVITMATAAQCASPYSIYIGDKGNTVYVSCYDGAMIAIALLSTSYTFSPSVNILITPSDCFQPISTYYTSGFAYTICSGGGNFIGSLVAISGTVVTNLASGSCLYPLAIYVDNSAAVTTAYAECEIGGISSMTSSTNMVVISAIGQCFGDSYIYMNAGSGTLFGFCNVFNGMVTPTAYAVQGSTVTLVTPPCTPSGIDMKNTTGQFFFACGTSGLIMTDRTGSSTTLTTSTTCPSANNVFVNQITGFIYVACSNGVIVIQDHNNVAKLTTPALCASASSLYVDGPSNMIYAACSNGVISINGVGGLVTTLMSSQQCSSATSLFFDITTRIISASCSANGGISVASAVDSVVITATVPTISGTITVNSATGIIYTTRNGGSQFPVSVASNFICESGLYWNQGNCVPCAVGTYRSPVMALSQIIPCAQCTIGSVAAVQGSARCSSCSSGSYAASPFTECVLCAAGTYTPVAAAGLGFTSCFPCPGGTYGAQMGLSSATCTGFVSWWLLLSARYLFSFSISVSHW